MAGIVRKFGDIVYEIVFDLIQKGQIDEAIKRIIQIEDKTDKIHVLLNLSRDLLLNISTAAAIGLNDVHTLAYNLNLSLSMAVINMYNDDDYNYNLVTARNTAHQINQQIGIVLSSDESASYFESSNNAILAKQLDLVISGVLDEEVVSTTLESQEKTFDVMKAIEVLTRMVETVTSKSTISVTGIKILTPQSLSDQITPYLQALFDLQAILDSLNKKQLHITPKITSISQNSPVEISFEGISEAVETVSTIVIPFRRRNAKKLAELEITEKELQIAQSQTELKARETEIRQEKKLSEVELEQKKLEVERTRIENEEKRLALEKIRLEIYQQKIYMALAVLKQLSPNLQEPERIAYIIQLIQPLGVLMESSLEITPKQ